MSSTNENRTRLTKEERAEISRRNGAKSKGPVTQMGKDISRMNALKHGRNVSDDDLIVPPHSSVLFSENRADFIKLYNQLKAHYRPTNQTELAVVRDIADTRWKLNRAKATETAIENRALYNQAVDPNRCTVPLICEVENFIIAMETIAKNPALLEARRQIRNLTRLLGTLNKQLADLRKYFPNTGHNLVNNDDEIEQEFLLGPDDHHHLADEEQADEVQADEEPVEDEPVADDEPVVEAKPEPAAPAVSRDRAPVSAQSRPNTCGNQNEPVELVENTESMPLQGNGDPLPRAA